MIYRPVYEALRTRTANRVSRLFLFFMVGNVERMISGYDKPKRLNY